MTLFIPQMWLLVKYTASKATSTVSDQRILFEARESFSVLERPHWPQGKFTVAGAFLIKDCFFFPYTVTMSQSDLPKLTVVS